MSEPSYDHPDIVLVEDGPMLVRGITSVRDGQGVVHRVERPVVGRSPGVCVMLTFGRQQPADPGREICSELAGLAADSR